MTQVFLTSANTSPFAKPADWQDQGHTVELVGSGGNGGGSGNAVGSRGGGGSGGGYVKFTYAGGAMGATTSFAVAGSGAATSRTNPDLAGTFWQTTGTATGYEARSGLTGTVATAETLSGGSGIMRGTAGLAIIYNLTTNGSGGLASNGTLNIAGGGGGGGAGGPQGAGGAGFSQGTAQRGGCGGGGANGGGAGVQSTGTTGGNGGNGSAGNGGGVGGTAGSNGLSGTVNTGGGGGGGGFGGASCGGGSGASTTTFSASFGLGGGGGGGGSTNGTVNTIKVGGGNGGIYGGGGGGAGRSAGNTQGAFGGNGGGGLIVITYNSQVLTQAPLIAEILENMALPPRLPPTPTFLLHFDGTAGATSFTDARGVFPYIGQGAAQISTSASKFGGASVQSDNTSWAINSGNTGAGELVVGLKDFTLDFWANVSSLAGNPFLMVSTLVGVIFLGAPGINLFNNPSTVITGTGTMTTNAWHHIAWTRGNQQSRLFLDGLQQGATYADSTDYGTLATNFPVLLGNPGGGASITGNMDEFRFILGTAQWTSNFIPPGLPYQLTPYTGPPANVEFLANVYPIGQPQPIELLRTVTTSILTQEELQGQTSTQVTGKSLLPLEVLLRVIAPAGPFFLGSSVIGGPDTLGGGPSNQQIELLTAIAGIPRIPAELLSAVVRRTVSQLELRAGVTNVTGLSRLYLELLETVRFGGVARLENLTGIAGGARLYDELLANVRGSAPRPLEYLTGVRGGPPEPMEYLANARAQIGERLEYLANSRSGAGLLDEFLANARSSSSRPLEYLVNARNGTPGLFEYLTGVRNGTPIPLEYLSSQQVSITSLSLLQIEVLRGMISGQRLPAEALLNVAWPLTYVIGSAGAIGDFNIGDVAIAGDGLSLYYPPLWNLELLANTRTGIQPQAELLHAVAGTARTNDEIISQTFGVTAVTALRLELLAQVLAGQHSPSELLLGTKYGAAVPLEQITGARMRSGDPLEFLASLSGSGRSPLEQLLSASVLTHTNEELTAFVSLVTALSKTPLELLAGVRGSTGGPLEAISASLVRSGIPAEYLSAMAARSAVRPELLAQATTVSRLYDELLLAATSGARTNEEILGFVQQVTGRSVLPLELLAGLAARGGARLEQLLGVAGGGGPKLELTGYIRSAQNVNGEVLASVVTRVGSLRDEVLLNVRFARGLQGEWLLGVARAPLIPAEVVSTVRQMTARTTFPVEFNISLNAGARIPFEETGFPITARIDHFTLMGKFELTSQLNGTFQVVFPIGGKVHDR